MLRERAAEHPERVAVVDGDRHVSYQRLGRPGRPASEESAEPTD
ncbi:hypothetical protein ACWDKQ_07715 [Saccharopolyspora sp. NPDC000995]